jgi:hypothetical protein
MIFMIEMYETVIQINALYPVSQICRPKYNDYYEED